MRYLYPELISTAKADGGYPDSDDDSDDDDDDDDRGRESIIEDRGDSRKSFMNRPSMTSRKSAVFLKRPEGESKDFKNYLLFTL